MKTISRVFAILGVMLFLVSVQAMGQGFKSDFQEADSQFSYQGQPIHPGLVQEFSSWISDTELPTTISVDVAAPHRNEYMESDVRAASGKRVCLDSRDIATDQKDGGWFCYEWLGKLNNGLHVLKTADGGQFGGIFLNLFFVRFDKGEGYTQEGEKRERLLMTIARTFVLGDRDDGEIEVQADKVIVGKSRYREQPTELKFQP